jgi:hypothetical protein
MTAHVIAEKPWSYVLFEDRGVWILTLLIGGVVEIDVSVRLAPDEVEAIKSGQLRIEDLVARVKRQRGAFAAREINPPVWPGR